MTATRSSQSASNLETLRGQVQEKLTALQKRIEEHLLQVRTAGKEDVEAVSDIFARKENYIQSISQISTNPGDLFWGVTYNGWLSGHEEHLRHLSLWIDQEYETAVAAATNASGANEQQLITRLKQLDNASMLVSK